MNKNLKKSIAGLAMFLVLFMSACSTKHSQSTPESAIVFAIHLLENKKHDEVIDKLMDPRYMQRYTPAKLLRLKARFKAGKKPQRFLEHLRIAKSTRAFKKTDTLVVYKVSETGRKLKLIKIGDKWYIKN